MLCNYDIAGVFMPTIDGISSMGWSLKVFVCYLIICNLWEWRVLFQCTNGAIVFLHSCQYSCNTTWANWMDAIHSFFNKWLKRGEKQYLQEEIASRNVSSEVQSYPLQDSWGQMYHQPATQEIPHVTLVWPWLKKFMSTNSGRTVNQAPFCWNPPAWVTQ